MDSSVTREQKRLSAWHRTWKYLTWLEISVFSRDIKARKKETRTSMRLIVISTSFWHLEINDENTHRSSFRVSFAWSSLLIDRTPTRPFKKRRLSNYLNRYSSKISWLGIVSHLFVQMEPLLSTEPIVFRTRSRVGEIVLENWTCSEINISQGILGQ